MSSIAPASRCHEGAVEEVDDRTRQLVAGVLGVLDPPDQLDAGVGKAVEQLGQEARDLDGVRRRGGEEREELSVLRGEVELEPHPVTGLSHFPDQVALEHLWCPPERAVSCAC
jgi:hypothetical protein